MPMSLTKDQGKNNSGVSDFNEKPSSPSPREFGPLLSATGIKCAPNSRGEGERGFIGKLATRLLPSDRCLRLKRPFRHFIVLAGQRVE